MTINHEIKETLFDKMNALEATFYLTGSRYFECARPDSDFDYFAEYSDDLLIRLSTIGFKIDSTSYSTDLNCSVIMKGIDWTGTQIHVQLVKDSALKARVQEIFKQKKILKPTVSEWNRAFMFNRSFTRGSLTLRACDVDENNNIENIDVIIDGKLKYCVNIQRPNDEATKEDYVEILALIFDNLTN